MPYYRRRPTAKKPRRKPTYRSNRYRRGKSLTARTTVARGQPIIPRTLSSPFGNAFSTRLVTTHSGTLTNGGLAYDNIQLQINSAWDPLGAEGTVAGRGYDTLATLYETYKVYGAKFDFTFFNNNNTPTLVGLKPTVETSYLSTFDYLLGAPNTVKRLLPPTSVQSRGVKASIYVSCSKVFGITKAQFNNDSIYEALVTTNPSEICRLMVTAIRSSAALGPDVFFTCTMSQYVKFFGLKTEVQQTQPSATIQEEESDYEEIEVAPKPALRRIRSAHCA